MPFVMFAPGASLGLQEPHCKSWEQADVLEGFFDSPCYHSCFQCMFKHFCVQRAIKPGADDCCHTHWAVQSSDHLQCSKKGTAIRVPLSRYKFTLKHYVQCVPSQSMASLWKPSSHGTKGIPHEMLLKADEYTHFIWSLFHLYMDMITFQAYNRYLICYMMFLLLSYVIFPEYSFNALVLAHLCILFRRNFS